MIESLLPNGKVLGGDDLPSLALFLVTYAECPHLISEVFHTPQICHRYECVHKVELAKLFAITWDYQDYDVHPAGVYEGLTNQ